MSSWIFLAQTSFSVNSDVGIYDLITSVPVATCAGIIHDTRNISINKIKFTLKKTQTTQFSKPVKWCTNSQEG